MMHEASRLRNGWKKKLAQGLGATVVLALLALLAVAATTPQTGATGGKKSGAVVRTDKAGYIAGDTVSISGEGFSPFESVMVRVAHADGVAEAGMGHEPWWVYADTNGNFETQWFLNPNDSAGNNFVVAADGASGSKAQAAFSRVAAISASPFSSGGTVQVNASGFNPNRSVTIQVNNQDALTTQSDQSGQVSASLRIPKGSSTGSYSLQAVAPDSGLVSNSIVMGGSQAAATTLSSSYATFFQLDGDASSTYLPSGATGLHDWDQVYADKFVPNSHVSGTAARATTVKNANTSM